MNFRVYRTSSYSYENQPCDEAFYAGKAPNVDRVNTPEWEVTLNSLEELVAFCRKHGDLIIKLSEDYPEPCIEIYDDYRE